MTHWAKPGVQCVCIFDGEWGSAQFGPFSIPNRVPMLHEVLTIRAVVTKNGCVFLEFEEIDTHQVDGFLRGDIAWAIHNFRPLIKRPTDISIFTRMLTPAPLKRVKA